MTKREIKDIIIFSVFQRYNSEGYKLNKEIVRLIAEETRSRKPHVKSVIYKNLNLSMTYKDFTEIIDKREL